MASSPLPPSLLARRRDSDDATIPFHTPAAAQATELTGYCPFVEPSLDASALLHGSSQAVSMWDTFRDLMIATQQFHAFHDGLPRRAKGLACLVLAFEAETPEARLNKLFSCVRVWAAQQGITMGLIPTGATVRTGNQLRASAGMPTIVVFRTALTRDAKFRRSTQFQTTTERLQRAPMTVLRDTAQWPRESDREGWLTALAELTSALKGQQ